MEPRRRRRRRRRSSSSSGGSSFLTAEGDDGSPAGQCETQRVDPTQLASSQDGRGDHLTRVAARSRPDIGGGSVFRGAGRGRSDEDPALSGGAAERRRATTRRKDGSRAAEPVVV